MKFEFLHPADQLVLMMDRIYRGRLTTTSGGNLSVLDENGDIWITPSGVDKGSLSRDDICRVTPEGQIFGPHRPSVEWPFHATIYKRRPDLRAVIHAHPPALVAFAAARVLPDTRLVADIHRILGPLTVVPYAMPGSQELGGLVSEAFGRGFDVALMENHGAAVGASDIFVAFMKLETFQRSASMELRARKLGAPRPLSERELGLVSRDEHLIEDAFLPGTRSSEEYEVRREMVKMIHRACRQKLFSSTLGTCSVRLDDGSFVITAQGLDLAYAEEADLVRVKDGQRERGKVPSPSAALHGKIYEKHPNMRSICEASSPNAMAFALTDSHFCPRTVPEGYAMLRQVLRAPFSALYLEQDKIVDMLSDWTPVMICENSHILACGDRLLTAFDRIEVMEATAESIVLAQEIGPLVHISDEDVEAINRAFLSG